MYVLLRQRWHSQRRSREAGDKDLRFFGHRVPPLAMKVNRTFGLSIAPQSLSRGTVACRAGKRSASTLWSDDRRPESRPRQLCRTSSNLSTGTVYKNVAKNPLVSRFTGFVVPHI